MQATPSAPVQQELLFRHGRASSAAELSGTTVSSVYVRSAAR